MEPGLAMPGGQRRARAALNLALVALVLLVSALAWQSFVHSPWAARLLAMNEIVFVGSQNLAFAAASGSGGAGCVIVITDPQGTTQQNPAPTGRCSEIDTTQGSAGDAFAAAAPQLYAMRPDGSDIHQLTNLAGGGYFSPVWSPDGAQIAAYVISDASGTVAHLVVMDADGSHARQIPSVALRLDLFGQPSGARLSTNSRLIAWSPDGAQLVAPVDVGQYALVNADGTNPRLFNGLFPTWSPDGRYLAYFVEVPGDGGSSSFGPQQYTIGLLDTRTSQIRRLSNVPLLNTEALAWSPDGRYLAYSAFPSSYISEQGDAVMLVRPDGSGSKKVAEWNSAQVQQIVWSPDSAKMAVALQGYEINQLGNARPDAGLDIWVANADGSNNREVGFGDDGTPSWAPDGKHLVYASTDDTALLIADTSVQPIAQMHSLPLSPLLGIAPCWSPLAGI